MVVWDKIDNELNDGLPSFMKEKGIIPSKKKINELTERIGNSPRVMIFTDGACSQNGTWSGGYSYLMIGAKGKVSCEVGYEYKSTNNRMEIMAVMSAIEDISYYEQRTGRRLKKITIISDSGNAVFPFMKWKWVDKWKNGTFETDAKNYDLWCNLIPLVIGMDIDRFEFIQIRGHGKCEDRLFAYYNDIVDKMAVYAREYIDERRID